MHSSGGVKGARHFTDLISWQLADELRVEIFRFTNRPIFRRDLKFHSQTEDAINSVCRNIAEGFGCETHPEFARFLGISRRSLNEVEDCLRAALLQRYVVESELPVARSLIRRLKPALGRLIAYLRRTPNPGPYRRAKT